ncbi:hypothetical protein B0F90DRAFT_1817399 [Multifurca ochricompacta]|uniref:Uncharacterized protein n=1 Tax=Multifurca ochricompacta TaxID=376703 RepID=A0AAD4M3L4_9AGAM|nr:hypothetical protein B0F90DRAFT_1817399 [Multifurca ochricompacta]
MDLEKLEELLQKPDHTEEEHAKILDLIDTKTLRNSADADPPLKALLYAAQGILYPTLSFSHIPDLLDILSQVERTREFSREHAKCALIWQRFYETRPSPKVRVLRKSDKDAIKRLLKPERLDATRRIFVCILEQTIRMHVLYLWTHPKDSYLLHHYLRIYFPWALGRHESQRLYHVLLTPEETARLAENGMSCFRFMRDAKLWEEQRLRELDVSVLPDSYFNDDQGFQALKAKFIGNLVVADIVESITFYLKKVQGMAQKMESLLG